MAGTILLVDDEKVVRIVGGKMLEKVGFSVLTASGGREALDVFRDHAEDIVCVILDLTMPRMDGEETFRELRRIDKTVRVIMSSGYNEEDITQRFVGKSLAGFIQKPYQIHELKDKLKQVLED
jgi:CheY-like chemotaxis protein